MNIKKSATLFLIVGIITNAFGQFDAPLSFTFQVDETLFNKNDLESKKIKHISCSVVEMDINNLHHIDTVETFNLYLNDDYRPFYYQDFYSEYNSKCICTFSYAETSNRKSCETTSSFKKRDGTITNIHSLNDYFFYNDKLISYYERGQNIVTSEITAKEIDTLLYENNKIIKKINYFFNPKDTMLMDSIIRSYSYDSLGQLIEYSILPSASFNHNIPIGAYGLYSPKAQYLYKYTDNIVNVDERHYYYYLPKDSFALSTYTIKKIELKNSSKIEELNDRSQIYYDALIFESGLYSFQYKLGDVKRVEYYRNSTLPKYILISTAMDKVIIYYFAYDT